MFAMSRGLVRSEVGACCPYRRNVQRRDFWCDINLSPVTTELNLHGFRGREYNSVAIGKTMKRLGFEKKTLHGVSKYLVTKVDYDQHSRENMLETREFIPKIF